MFVDWPLEKLRQYQPSPTEPADFDEFWGRTLDETRQFPLDARFEPVVDSLYREIAVADVSFRGFGGQVIRGWFIEAAAANQVAATPLRRPCIVSFVGYGGGRGFPLDHVAPLAAGFAHFVMDTRGQGSVWSPGDTPDDAPAGPHAPGFVTRGIESAETYYYRRVFADAVRAVEAAATHPHVDPRRIAVCGGSQGGGLAIAAAALARERIAALAADVPFLSDIRRATEITNEAPYSELVKYLSVHRARVADVFRTLAYFDVANHAPRVRAPALFSAALMDPICPPSTVFAAYNRITTSKEIRVYDYNAHEGGGSMQAAERLRFLAGVIGAQASV